MIEIVKPGFFTTIQDYGRTGYQRYGVPVCGAMDWAALAKANFLAGNPWGEGALELTGIGPSVLFHSDGIFALAGADFSAALDGKSIPANSAFFARKGSLLTCGGAKEGFRGYLAASGGLDLPEVMGSRSTCLAAGFGGLEGRILREGDRIGLRGSQLWLRGMPQRRLLPPSSCDQPLRVILGPQREAFSEEGLERFFTNAYRLTQQCDRMGFRLEGAVISLKPGKTPNILSDGVTMGSIQVPNGQPIIMMADRQTTGGYVKLGTVITTDLPRLAQKRPGDTVRFAPVTVEEGQRLRREQFRLLRNLEADLNRETLW